MAGSRPRLGPRHARPLALATLAWLVTGAAALSACSNGSQAAQRGEPEPTAPDTGRVPALDGKLTVPTGFNVAYFARLSGVRAITLGPDGAVYASVPRDDKIVRLADTNGDGVADQQTTAVSGLDNPFGMAFHNGWLYIANESGVVRVRLDAAGKALGAPERLNSYGSGGNHRSRSIIFGPDEAMYVSIGSSCNVCVERSPDRAAVMRYDENGQNGRLFARGLRNAVGIAVNPVTHELWVSQHERDDIEPDHQDLPPEEINILRDGADYGWPYCYTYKGKIVPNPEYHDPARCANTVPAALEMQAHSAPMMLTFLDRATNFPESYRGDALLAFRGSWDRDIPTGAKVVRIHIENNKPVSYENFVTGWQRSDGSRWGRPVGVLVYTDGSVLISDDAGGAIYRVYR